MIEPATWKFPWDHTNRYYRGQCSSFGLVWWLCSFLHSWTWQFPLETSKFFHQYFLSVFRRIRNQWTHIYESVSYTQYYQVWCPYGQLWESGESPNYWGYLIISFLPLPYLLEVQAPGNTPSKIRNGFSRQVYHSSILYDTSDLPPMRMQTLP